MDSICEPDPTAKAQIDALPSDAVRSLAEALEVLSVSPWSGTPLKPDNPNCTTLTWAFGRGRGMVTYLVMEPQREVYIVRVHWL
nr:MAG: hypothetical protein DIU60_02405 [Actinomycetota bacterium]